MDDKIRRLCAVSGQKGDNSHEHRYTRPLAIAVLLALVAAVVILTKPTASVKAQTEGVPKAPMVTGVNHILQGTYINTCIPSCPPLVIFPEELLPLDAVTTINCPAPTGKTCTITDDMWIELQNTSTNSNNTETLLFSSMAGGFADQFNDGGAGISNSDAQFRIVDSSLRSFAEWSWPFVGLSSAPAFCDR